MRCFQVRIIISEQNLIGSLIGLLPDRNSYKKFLLRNFDFPILITFLQMLSLEIVSDFLIILIYLAEFSIVISDSDL